MQVVGCETQIPFGPHLAKGAWHGRVHLHADVGVVAVRRQVGVVGRGRVQDDQVGLLPPLDLRFLRLLLSHTHTKSVQPLQSHAIQSKFQAPGYDERSRIFPKGANCAFPTRIWISNTVQIVWTSDM